MSNLRHDFIEFALRAGVLSFGDFLTKAGRRSPYFFNAGHFNRGATLGQLGRFYARKLIEAEQEQGLAYDMLFGPAYKGITLASATAVALAESAPAKDVAFAYNRKEVKDHGEGGALVGAKLAGRVVIVDDVISAGTSIRESVQLIRAAGAIPAGVLIALDRMERGGTAVDVSTHSAVQDVQREFQIPVLSIINLDDVMGYLANTASPELVAHRSAVAAYRDRYGIVPG